MSELTDDLWSYTLHLYGKPGVPSACLALQDVHGIDVPLLIFATWLARRGAALTTERAAIARDGVTPWHVEIVRGLRQVRQRMKHGPSPAPSADTETLRDAVKKVELASEKLELDTLAAISQDWARGDLQPVLPNLVVMFTAMTGKVTDDPALSLLAGQAELTL